MIADRHAESAERSIQFRAACPRNWRTSIKAQVRDDGRPGKSRQRKREEDKRRNEVLLQTQSQGWEESERTLDGVLLAVVSRCYQSCQVMTWSPIGIEFTRSLRMMRAECWTRTYEEALHSNQMAINTAITKDDNWRICSHWSRGLSSESRGLFCITGPSGAIHPAQVIKPWFRRIVYYHLMPRD